MIYSSVQGIGINSEVSNTHSLKKQTESIQITNQIIRSETKSSHTNWGIYKIPCIRCTYRCFAPQIRIPCRHILNDKYLSQCRKICIYCYIAHIFCFICWNIGNDCCNARLRTLVSGIRTHNPLGSFRISLNSINSRNITIDDSLIIFRCLQQGSIFWFLLQRFWPASPADGECKHR